MNPTLASSFSNQAWERNAPVYEAIRTMPFNTELAAGVLDRARFTHYITQDAHYRLWARLGARRC
jgi:thiaminase (transcriptional activator TenA)